MTAKSPPRSGSEVHGYRLEGELGQGPSGCVFRAVHVASGRKCAVKLFKSGRVSPAGIARYAEVARVVSRVQDASICRVSEVITEGEVPLSAMALAPGASLAELIRRQSLAPPFASQIAGGICRSLGVVHRAKLVHGNLKPGNVTIEHAGEEVIGVHILDVGSYTLMTQDQDAATWAHDLFPVSYQSPEQLMGEEPCPASDFYSLGVMLFEAITGRLPFTGAVAEVAIKHMRDAPPRPSSLVDGLSLELEAIILQLLAKDPHRRFASASEISSALALVTPSPARLDDETPTRAWVYKQDARADIPASTADSSTTDECDDDEATTLVPGVTLGSAQRQVETVVLSAPMPNPGDSGSITLLPPGMGGEFLLDAEPPQNLTGSPTTMVSTHPSATMFVTRDALDRARAAPVVSDRSFTGWIPERLRWPWSSKQKLVAVNIACLLIVLIGLIIMVT